MSSLALSPDGPAISLGGANGAITLLDAGTGQRLFVTRSVAKSAWP